MLGPGWFYDQNGSLVHESDIGAFVGDRKPLERVAGLPRTRTPITRTRIPLRRIGGGSPAGALNSVKTWWASLSKEWRWGIVGGIGVLAVITAALGKKEGKSTWLKKV